MHIVFASSEAAPYSKTGGLGDVAGALPHALAGLGHAVDLYAPFYRSSRRAAKNAKKIAEGQVPVGTEMLPYTVHEVPAVGKARVLLVGNDALFDRDGLYGERGRDYQDTCARYTFFCRAVLDASHQLGEPVDVFHAHDWQTAMIPICLKLDPAVREAHRDAASLFTIHNLAYQGLFWHWDWPLLNLAWQHFNWHEMEFHGKINFLKGALVHADLLNTVSPNYAREIQTPEFGYGLEGVLGDRADELFGVVNGIDTAEWDPMTDKTLAAPFSADDLTGKAACRKALLERFKLKADDDTPVIGLIGRLVEQKGFDLIARGADKLARRNVRVVVLGTGDEKVQERLTAAARQFSDRIGVAFAFDNDLAHQIQAGSDAHLMPSRFEPCGLNQLYALRYGAVPIVRKVGGLADTVTDASSENLAAERATGFVFDEFDLDDLLAAVDRAVELFRTDRAQWTALQARGMKQDFGWSRSAESYAQLYARAKRKLSMK